MNTLTILIGIPGSGKSTYAENHKDAIHISSDAIRGEILGDVKDQSNNGLVFQTMFARTVKALRDKQNVIYDATNISRKKRIGLINELKRAVKMPFEVKGIVIATSLAKCLENNSNRTRKVPEDVIFKMLKNFEMPVLGEGFDSIELVYPFNEINKYSMGEYLSANALPHDNPHHELDIDEHMKEAVSIYHSITEDTSTILEEAILLHDIGKFMVKDFTNSKGEPTEAAHYYQHDKVGGYLSLFVKSACGIQDILYRAMLICYHMDPYFNYAKNITDSEMHDTLWKKFRSNVFVEDLLTLHACDAAAH